MFSFIALNPKDELVSRLKEPSITNNRGWNWQHGSQCNCGDFLAQGQLDAEISTVLVR